MLQDMLSSPVFQYIIEEGLKAQDPNGQVKLPSMDELCQQLGISRGKLREELIAAQACGVVEMRPGDGTYVRPFDFYTPIHTLLLYSVALDRKNFDRYYQLRVQLEAAFWEEATRKLHPEDLAGLRQIVERAEHKLAGERVEIPHREHREFHLFPFMRLDNEFVLGLLRAYWDVYEAVGLHLYFDLGYFQSMWNSHRAMLEAVEAGDYARGRELLIEHFTLLSNRLQKDR